MEANDAPVVSCLNVVLSHHDLSSGYKHSVRINRFTVSKQGLVVVVGPNGSGKSTFLDSLALLKRPDAADEFVIADQNVMEVWKHRSRCDDLRRTVLGISKQRVELSASLTVRENIELPQSLFGVLDRDYVDELLIRLSTAETQDLVRAANSQVSRVSLSGGQLQRVGLARALAHRPHLLVVDEPTANLDPRTAVQVVAYLNELRVRDGLTIVVATHQPDLFAPYASEIVEMTSPAPGRGEIIGITPGINRLHNILTPSTNGELHDPHPTF